MTTLLLLVPKAALAFAVVLALLLDSLPVGRPRRVTLYIMLAAFVAGIVCALLVLGDAVRIWQGAVVLDRFSTFTDIVLLGIGVLVTLAVVDTLGSAREGGDFFLLVTLSLLGSSILASAGDLIVLFLGIELAIIPTWALVAFRLSDRSSFEAAFKYFLLSAFATSVLLYGLSLVYGTAGTIRLPVGEPVPSSSLLYIGIGMVIVGFAFDLAAFPFHQWLPDVFQVAYAEVGGFLAVAPKLAAVVGLARFLAGFPDQRPGWTVAVAVVSAVTMFWGNIVAFWQSSLKRLLAYSAVAHAGYALVGIAAGNGAGLRGAILYYAAYGTASMGAFLVIAAMGRRGWDDSLSSFDQLGRRAPGLAATMTLFLLSLTGIPLLAGFWGKFSVFWGAVQGGMTWLAVLGVLNSALSFGYYARVIQRMYLDRPAAALDGGPAGPPPRLTEPVLGIVAGRAGGYAPPPSRELPGSVPVGAGPARLPVTLTVALWLAVVLTVVLGVVPSLLFGAVG